MDKFLNLPSHENKPRQKGLTILIDNGSPLGYFSDVLKSHGQYIDYIKFGWGTAYITQDIEQKIEQAHQNEVKVFFGGTFFEKAWVQKKMDPFLKTVKQLGCDVIEISNGTIDMDNKEKAMIIADLAPEFTIFSEVGYKEQLKSQELHPAKWIEYINEDLEAGATKVITEARESGQSGICRSNGELRFGLIEEIIHSGIDLNRLIFEAPNKSLQTYFIEHISHEVNLANIPFDHVIPLETLRLGLRSDTLGLFD